MFSDGGCSTPQCSAHPCESNAFCHGHRGSTLNRFQFFFLAVREATHEPNRGPVPRDHTAQTKSTPNPQSRPDSPTHRSAASSCASIPEESEESSMDENTRMQTLSVAPAGEACEALSSADHSSNDSTQLSTRASDVYQTKFHALEQIIQREQKELDFSGKITSDRLTTIEKQLSRLDEFDTKLSAVRAQLVQAAKHQLDLTTSLQEINTQNRETQQQAKTYQTQSDRKIDTLGNTVVNVMTSIMEMQAHFEQMSIFMQQMATGEGDGPTGNTGKRDRSTEQSKAASGQMMRQSSSQTSTSSRSRASDESSQSTSCFHSPQKKKQNSAPNSANEEGDDTGQTDSVYEMMTEDDSSQSSVPNGRLNLDSTLSSMEATYPDPEFPPLSLTQPPPTQDTSKSVWRHTTTLTQYSCPPGPSL
jgi:hypothetical protein